MKKRSLVGLTLKATVACWLLAGGPDGPLRILDEPEGSGTAMAQEEPGQQAAEPRGARKPAEEPDRRQRKSLSLRQAIESAVANNLDVAIRKKDPESAELAITQADSAFDPRLESTFSYGRGRNEPLSDFASEGRKSWTGTATWSQLLDQGFSYSANWSTNKTTTIYPAAAFELGFFSPISPTYTSVLSLSFSQPLLRGAGYGVNKTEVEIAKLDLATSEETFRRVVIDTIALAESAYWDLSAAISNLDVAQESLRLAEKLYADNQRRVEVGVLAPIQITEARAGVASREESVILAEAAIMNAEDSLRRIMNVPPDSSDWDRAIDPIDKPPFEPITLDLESIIQQALENRAEVLQGKQALRSQELRLRLAENTVKPGLNVVGNYAPSGNNYDFLGTQLVDRNNDGTIDGSVDVFDLGGLSDSAAEVFDAVVYDWSLGLNFSIPVGNRQAKASEARARIAVEQARLSLENLQRNIRVEVRVAARAVETGIKRVTAARENVRLQEEKLDAEQKRYDNGMSTSFQVLTFQNDLTAARNAEIAAITAYNKALAELGRVTATLHEKRGVSIARASRMDDSAAASAPVAGPEPRAIVRLR